MSPLRFACERTQVLGMPIFLESSHTLPVVDVAVRVAAGAEFDPEGMEGLARLTLKTLRAGPRGMSERRTEEQLAGLGARLHVATTRRSLRISGSVLTRQLAPFFALLSRMLREPALRGSDLSRQRRETHAMLMAQLDDDDALAARHVRKLALGAHPFARSTVGVDASLARIDAARLRGFLDTHLRRGNLSFGFAGDIGAGQAEALVREHFGDLPGGRSRRPGIPATKLPRGRHVRIVDKPERTQTPMTFSALGSHLKDPLLDALIVANTVFGGTFASRLNNELRTKRGFTYGASSQLGRAEKRELWSMHSAPEAEHTVACAQLHLDLLERWVERGVTQRELNAAKRFLAGSYAFDVETPSKRLDLRLDRHSVGLDPDAFVHYPARMLAVTLQQANDALRARITPDHLALVVVAEAPRVQEQLAQLKGVRSVEVRPYTQPAD
ncbi:MAG: insulinase family protein [Sandaracinaceae bacterium]|nr:insulinase family protein [Myxococcales bacterium]MCB9657785.1 insulinase family protein [Sandaracinaceae bacterium]